MHIATEDTPTPMPAAAPVTFESALGHAARLLLHAELETNLPLMERLERLADSWIAIARTLTEVNS